jgi:hypothetical protein
LRSAFTDLHYEELEVFASKDMVISTLFVTGEQLRRSSVEDVKAAISISYFQMIDDWNREVVKIFASPFAEDDDLVGFDGTHLKKRQNIELSPTTFFIPSSKETEADW